MQGWAAFEGTMLTTAETLSQVTEDSRFASLPDTN